jgi:hypothetical protein
MNHVRRIVVMVTGLVGAALALTAVSPAAFATRVPAPGDSGAPARVPPQIHMIVVGGMPGWQITLIAAGTALAAAALTVVADRAWAARRHPAIPSA